MRKEVNRDINKVQEVSMESTICGINRIKMRKRHEKREISCIKDRVRILMWGVFWGYGRS